jgi:hypothetical protein
VNLLKKIKSYPFIIRLFNWEYWPFHLIYAPVYPVWLWYCLGARSFFFFGASNPTIKNGGFLMESKKEIDRLIPAKFKPLTLFFSVNTPGKKLIDTLKYHQMQYPLIIKPDIGMKGKAVIKVNNEKELLSAASQFTIDYIIQPFIHYPREVGIFYVRYPNEKEGRITGIVEKEFLTVIGDGVSSIKQLLYKKPRHRLQIQILKKSFGSIMDIVLKSGEEKILVPYGNHVRGSLFLDSTYKNSVQLQSVIDKASRLIRGFYFGRLDIRFNSFEELAEDKNWCIIELNGAGSEPTHMYDPKHSLFFAWKEITRHWKLLYEVSMQNKERGYPFLAYKEGIVMLKANRSHVEKLNQIQFESINHESIKKDTQVCKSQSYLFEKNAAE